MAEGSYDTVTMEDGRQLTIRTWTAPEMKKFERDWYFLIASFTKHVIDGKQRHVFTDVYENAKGTIQFFGQVCGAEIEPRPGAFNGMTGKGGYGMRKIRPQDLTPNAQGATWDFTNALAVNTWGGMLHFAAIGTATAAALYMRKFLGTVVIGMWDVSGNPLFEEFQWDNLEGSQYPIEPAFESMRGLDLAIYQPPNPVLLRPAKMYRLLAKPNAGAGTVGCLIPMGVTFIRYEDSLVAAQTAPLNTPP